MFSKSVLKSALTCFISVVFCFVLMGSHFAIKQSVFALDTANGAMFNQYYRLRNVSSDLYLTMNSATDADNVGCRLSPYLSGDSKQIFYLKPDFTYESFYLTPMSSSSERVLSLYGTTTGNNIPIVIKTNTSAATQRWRIYTSTYGYYLRSDHNGKTIAPSALATANGTDIVSWTYVAESSDWILEPAYSGLSSYFVTTSDVQNDSTNNATVNRNVTLMQNLGYTTERVDLPQTARLNVRLPNNRLTVIHGHGTAGMIALEQTDGSTDNVYSENAPSGSTNFAYSMERSSLVVFITCKGGLSTSERCSMAQAAYNQGAACVIAFRNNVSLGEEYIEMVLYYMETANMSVEDAVAVADGHYPEEKRNAENCPANPSNRVIIGQGNMRLEMT